VKKPKITKKRPEKCHFLLKRRTECQKYQFFFVPLQGKIIKDGKKEDIIHQSGDFSLCSRQRLVGHG
jgi:hypothetical protein